MKKFVSISEYPGTSGTYFYNNFFREYNLDAEYRALSADINTFETVFKDALDTGVEGISVSMPFKRIVKNFCDDIDITVRNYDLCNTVLIENGRIKGHNCDLHALEQISPNINNADYVKILGNGAIGSMVAKFLAQTRPIQVFARSLGNWHLRHASADVVFNCTALGTIPGCPLDHLGLTTQVYDYCIGSVQLPELCQSARVKYIGGLEFYKYQFSKQFELYTKLKFNSELFDKLKQAKYD